MRFLLLFVVFAFPPVLFAETSLCVADAGAIVEDGGGQSAKAWTVDVAASKYVLTEKNGNLVVKQLGQDGVLFDECVSRYFCESSRGYSGTFMRTNDGRFTIVWFSMRGDRELLIAAKGRCSQI